MLIDLPSQSDGGTVNLSAGALDPPPHHVPNFDSPSNGNTLTRVVVGLALGICSVFVFGRLYVIWDSKKRVDFADCLLLLGFGTYIAYGAIILDSTNNVGYLIHQWDVRLSDAIYLSRNFVIGSNIFAISGTSIKAAILLEWLRIFNPSHERNSFFWAAHSTFWLNFLFHTALFISFNAACTPYARSWDPFLQGTCYQTRPIPIVSSAVDLIIDISIFCLPQRIIWKLQLSKKKKQGVAIFFGVGIFAIISVIVRIAIGIRLYTSTDRLYAFYSLALFGIVDIGCGIIIYCVPSMPKALKLLQYRLHLMKTLGNNDRQNNRGTFQELSSWNRQPAISNRIERPPRVCAKSARAVQSCDSSLPSAYQGQQEHVESGILRTTVFTAVSLHESSLQWSGGDEIDRQHPWISVDERTPAQ
ncbi:hypothetical protein GGR51DRAFT_576936 [Nemania sp. FL0031]|nr:hypothetical protein GGR51DRAFT_576936 [Nemania sp. FL0031]